MYRRYKPNNGRYPSSKKGYTRSIGYYGRFGVGTPKGLKPELKFLDTVSGAGKNSAGAIPAAATEGSVVITTDNNTLKQLTMGGTLFMGASINLVQGGTSPNQMIGNKIMIKYIQVRLFLQKQPFPIVSSSLSTSINSAWASGNNGAAALNDFYWIMLILDTQCNGSMAQVNDILQYNDATGQQPQSAPWNVFSFLNMGNSKRFKIIKSWRGELQNNTVGVSTTNSILMGDSRIIDDFEKVNTVIETSGAANKTYSDIKSNNYFMLGLSYAGTINITGTVRIRYSDV